MPMIQKITASKLISEADMKALEHKVLNEDFIRTTLEADTECWDEEGRCVFVFLRKVIPTRVQRPALQAADTKLKFNSTDVSQRAALKGVGGGELNFGWSDSRVRLPKNFFEAFSWPGQRIQDVVDPFRAEADGPQDD
jgi:hypothetical protein